MATRSNRLESRCRISLGTQMLMATCGGVLCLQSPNNVNHYHVTPTPKDIRGPWNPVAIKKVDQHTESAIVNGASVYSYSFCSKTN